MIEKIEDCVRKAAAYAVMLEPTGWGIAGNVSRAKDHKDKSLQDYIVFGYMFGDWLIEAIKQERGDGSGLTSIVREAMKRFKTNLAFGEIFLIYMNAFGAIKNRSTEPDIAAEGGIKLSLNMSANSYIEAIRVSSPSFIGRFSSSLIPSATFFLTSQRDEVKAVHMLRLNVLDPVSIEVSRGFPFSRAISKKLLSRLSCRIPRSEDIDSIFREFCCIYSDFLVYRKEGIDEAERASKECCLGKTDKSLGSISDIVALTLFYYFLKCCGSV